MLFHVALLHLFIHLLFVRTKRTAPLTKRQVSCLQIHSVVLK